EGSIAQGGGFVACRAARPPPLSPKSLSKQCRPPRRWITPSYQAGTPVLTNLHISTCRQWASPPHVPITTALKAQRGQIRHDHQHLGPAAAMTGICHPAGLPNESVRGSASSIARRCHGG